MSQTASETKRPAKQPEVKFGPYAGGIGVAVWLNTTDTPDGRREMRSITIAPRRYLDKVGDWQEPPRPIRVLPLAYSVKAPPAKVAQAAVALWSKVPLM